MAQYIISPFPVPVDIDTIMNALLAPKDDIMFSGCILETNSMEHLLACCTSTEPHPLMVPGSFVKVSPLAAVNSMLSIFD